MKEGDKIYLSLDLRIEDYLVYAPLDLQTLCDIPFIFLKISGEKGKYSRYSSEKKFGLKPSPQTI